MATFISLIKQHLKRNPEILKALKEEGIYEETVERIAGQARRDLAEMVARGYQLSAAREIVEQEYIYQNVEINRLLPYMLLIQAKKREILNQASYLRFLRILEWVNLAVNG